MTGRTATRLCAAAFGLVAVACTGPAPPVSSSLDPPEAAHDGPVEEPAEPNETGTSVDAVPKPTDPPDVTASSSPSSSVVPVDGGPSDEMRAIDVEWVATMSGPSNNDEFDGVAVGLDGSVFVTGQFVESTTIAGIDFVSRGKADIPFARFDDEGELLWAASFGGIGEDNFFDVDADDAGVIATGYFEGVVEFGDVTIEAAGDTDCVVASFGNDGDVNWVSTFGGVGPDGCNEVTIAADGSIVTSVDTVGGWTVDGVDLSSVDVRDTVLLQLDRSGRLDWARAVGGPGTQRGKSIGVGAGGMIVFGGDTRGDLLIADSVIERPGRGFDAWLSAWTPQGELLWTQTWGGPGDDLSKGVAVSDDRVYAIGPFEREMSVGDTVLSSRGGIDLAVIGFDMAGDVEWATTIGAEANLPGAEVILSGSGGVIVPGTPLDGVTFSSADGSIADVDTTGAATAWIAEYDAEGNVVAVAPIPGTLDANASEIDRYGDRLLVDMVIRGIGNTTPGGTLDTDGKDASIWSLRWPDR